MEIHTVVERRDSAQYDGTNGAEIVEMFEGTVISDDGTLLVFRHPNESVHRVAVGSHILFVDNRGVNDGYCDWKGSYLSESFNRKYQDSTTQNDRLALLETEVAALKQSRP